MDIATLAGIGFGTVVVLAAILLGGSASAFINVPSILIVFGGTIAGTLIRFALADVVTALKLGSRNAFTHKKQSPTALIEEAVELARLARTKGQLALEGVPVSDETLRKGVRMFCDGLNQDLIFKVLSTDRDLTVERLDEGEKVFRFIGDAAPAFGMIGTLVGLVQMLSTMSDPETIGPAMAVALLTTLYGALIANLVALPIADKLANKSQAEYLSRSLVIQAVNSIAEKHNPDVMYQLLETFLPQADRKGLD